MTVKGGSTRLIAFLRGRGKLLLGLLAAVVFLVLAVILPVSLKVKSSRRSASSNAAAIPESTAIDQEEALFSAIPTDAPVFDPWNLSLLPVNDDDDEFSNSRDGSAISFLRPHESSSRPSGEPSFHPEMTSNPSTGPTELPTVAPSGTPSSTPSTSPTQVTSFLPGLLTHMEHGLLLSQGLTARILALTGQQVLYQNLTHGDQSAAAFHGMPDFGATFVDTRPENPGGWIYVSNSEMETAGTGGVGAFTFDPSGNVLRYEMVLTGTTMNCGGGRTPWDSWISCEETKGGQNYQVFPTQPDRPSFPITLGTEGGHWESFAFDVRDRIYPKFFVTEDAERGALQRFTPYNVSWDHDESWKMLHGPGKIEYLMLDPNSAKSGGTFSWGTNRASGRANAQLYYPNSEGIDVYGSRLYFVCKKIKQLFELDLDAGTYTNQSTTSGLFDGGPDQLQRILIDGAGDYLFFTEEGGKDAGVHGRDSQGNFYTILESPTYKDETTGLAFSPDAKHLYVAFQKTGLLFDVTRLDGLPFHAKSLNVKYHAAA